MAPPGELTLTPADKGRTVTVRRGDSVSIRLPENPSTGFQWALEPGDEAVLALCETGYAASAGSGVGAGGWRSWTFSARASGSARVSIKRWRPWEGERSVVDRFGATVRVEG